MTRPRSLELEYTRFMMAPLLFRSSARWPVRVLQIGLGAASITKYLHHARPRARLTIVETARDVIVAARQFFQLPDDGQRIVVELGDGFDYVARAKAKFDFIIVDGFDAKGHTGMLETAAFYAHCRARLSDDGVVAVNLLGRRRGTPASIERLSQSFDNRVVALPRCDAGNIVVLGAVGRRLRVPFAIMRERAHTLRTDTELNLLPMVNRLVKQHAHQSALSI